MHHFYISMKKISILHSKVVMEGQEILDRWSCLPVGLTGRVSGQGLVTGGDCLHVTDQEWTHDRPPSAGRPQTGLTMTG